MLELDSAHTSAALSEWACALRHIRVRFQIIGNARITNVGKSQSCMVSTLPIIWKQTVHELPGSDLAMLHTSIRRACMM